MSDKGNWRSNCPNLGYVMSKAKDRNLFTDIQFVIGEDSVKRTFHAHKSILACGSPVFEKMFFGDMPEKRNPIVIKDDDPEAFDLLINYIYGDDESMNIKSFLSAWNYYCIGDKYLVEGVADDVKRFVQLSSMKEEDFWDLIQCNLHTNPLFTQKLITYLYENAVRMLRSKKFINVPENLVRGFLQKENISAPESVILQCVTKWGDANFDNGERPHKMLQLLQLIKFSFKKSDEFSETKRGKKFYT